MTKKLTPLDIERIKKDRLQGAEVRQIAKAYGVTRQHIYLLLRKDKKKGLLGKLGEFLWGN